MSGTVTVQIWKGRTSVDEAKEPDETVEVPVDGSVVWQDDPWYTSIPLGFHIAENDRPATLNIYTNDSVRAPPESDPSEWNGPVERGLHFAEDAPADPFGCEIWGRVMFTVDAEP